MQLHRNDAECISAVSPAASTERLQAIVSVSEAEIYAVKRQYLGLLPPQQVIDVCLTFEAHAPLHVKSSVWPYDIRAAIASIQTQKVQGSQTQTPPEPDSPSKTRSLAENTENPQPSSSKQPAPSPSQARLPASTSSVSQPVASQPQVSPPGPHYPHQPYYHPTYPHAPYITSPHPAYCYPHPYPSYPQPPALYANPAGHPPLFTNAPLPHPAHSASEPPPPLTNVEDLPSYEEMIVEALVDSGDPEGCAPKSLFSWMAMHYPLQTNFRPSASQALQKAYKRGRLEKGSNGKYRLNESWEGGNTSRRTTRRPQTLAQTVLPGSQPHSSSPFTQTPLVPHGPTGIQTRLPPPGQPPGYGGYPFGYPYQGTSVSVHETAAKDSPRTVSQKQTAHPDDRETGEGSDAWEAAQNILKAINFGQLFKISSEEDGAGAPSTSVISHDQQTSAGGPVDPLSASGTVAIEEPTGARPDGAWRSAELDGEQRAALQARLALLAAQLAELADVSEDELSYNLDAPPRTGTASDASAHQVLAERPGLGDGSDDNSDDNNEDMVEVPVPMDSLTA